ncbi:hypothetical protein H4R34_001189 [Dimargaris verticillata]|uniref:Ferritin-like superfamily n=1 Tax=Dimargaris verticillata TaxID=2761393 RepID=A0A9W8EEQ8_9FUNG|nr:hypothetical protein H4R34_001189 [Dimargaris verticillata]
MATTPPTTLCDWCLRILHTPDPSAKVAITQEFSRQWQDGIITEIGHGVPPERPARPDRFVFVEPGKAPKLGKAGSLWAIDTALDNIVRFAQVSLDSSSPAAPMPRAFFDDFVRMAAEEAKHFLWLVERLEELGSHFGALPIHAGIWESAAETAHDICCRMAIVHMVHEARGLDVNPTTINNFAKAGDTVSADMLTTILADEVTHVETGHRWFAFVCQKRAKDKREAFHAIVKKHFKGVLKPPFNEDARRAAGMEPELYHGLETKERTA